MKGSYLLLTRRLPIGRGFRLIGHCGRWGSVATEIGIIDLGVRSRKYLDGDPERK
jgi:hypothetical protein